MNLQTTFVRIEPAALYSLLEQFQRRSESCPLRLVGAVFGRILQKEEDSDATQFEIEHCFPVPHSEVGDQVAINAEYFKTRSELYRKYSGGGSGKDQSPILLLGWYSVVDATAVGSSILESNTAFIHDIFAREVQQSGSISIFMHLQIRITDGGIQKTALLCECAQPTVSHEVPVPVHFYSQEAYALNAILKGLLAKEDPQSNLVHLQPLEDPITESLSKLKEDITKLSQPKIHELVGKIDESIPKRLNDELSMLAAVNAKLDEQIKVAEDLLTRKLPINIVHGTFNPHN